MVKSSGFESRPAVLVVLQDSSAEKGTVLDVNDLLALHAVRSFVSLLLACIVTGKLFCRTYCRCYKTGWLL